MKNEKGKLIINIIFYVLILMIGFTILRYFYKTNNFNGFQKAMVDVTRMTEFKRDSNVKYLENDSYRIENKEYNDATIYKEIEVEPNTPYRLSCMVKTQDVSCEKTDRDGGVLIGLLDTTEYSAPITGTNDWQRIEYMFNSRNRTKINLSFRLGGNQNACIGTAWFADFKLEKGTPREENIWKICCYIIDEIDVNIEGKEYNFQINDLDIENVKLNMERFKNDCYNYSNKRMEVNYEIKRITTPINTLTYSDEHGYYIGNRDIKDEIYEDVQQNEYDHVFIICRMENELGTESIPIYNNWIGLGGMDMYGIGYSIIRLNKSSNSVNFKFGMFNKTPEEVYLHEFLHTLERNMIENGYEVPALHENEKYGYLESAIDGLDKWYKDYMAGAIVDRDTNEQVGLNDFVYNTQPPNNSNFNNATEIKFNNEPKNIIENILAIKDCLTQ